MKNWLNRQVQRMVFNGSIKSGVPPELILGSILFNTFINYLHECTDISFASNTNLRGDVDRVEGRNGRLGVVV